MIGMPNRIIHGYDAADIGVLCVTPEEDLPELIRMLEEEIPKLEQA